MYKLPEGAKEASHVHLWEESYRRATADAKTSWNICAMLATSNESQCTCLRVSKGNQKSDRSWILGWPIQ